MTAHEIDYHIYGEEMQYVEIELDPQEIVVAEAGSFMMMENGIQMQTIFGDGSQQQQGILINYFLLGKSFDRRKSFYDGIHQSKHEKSKFLLLRLIPEKSFL
jgi:uncharacterized protein (AIM24 family)